MSTISSFRSIENKHDVHRGKYYMKNICESLREHVMKINNFKQKKTKSLTKEQQESYKNANFCHICKEKFKNRYVEDKNILKLDIIVIIQGNIEVLCIACVI